VAGSEWLALVGFVLFSVGSGQGETRDAMKRRERFPEERHLTIRQAIVGLLAEGDLEVGELSRAIGKSEKELYDHLEHLLRAKALAIVPAECLHCGYRFEKRDKVKKPGKCPRCKGTHLRPPLFRASMDAAAGDGCAQKESR